MPGALHEIRVLDLFCDTAGAYACMLLGDMGADVIKVEPLGGERLRSRPEFRLWNRGRRSIALDLDSPDGRQVLARLVQHCDALVETMSPAEARRRALDFASLGPLNERLVYCAISPFGEESPMADLPSDEGVVSSYAGVYGDQGGWQEPPVYVHLPIASYAAALLAAYAVCAALFARQHTGRGQKVEVPLFAAAIAMQAGHVVVGPRVRSLLREAKGQQGHNPIYRLYQCSDDWLFLACGNVTFWNKLCIALERLEWVEDPRFDGAPWNIPVEHRDALAAMIADILRQRPRHEWLARFAQNDVPCAPVQSRESFASHPQVVHNQVLVERDDPVLGSTRCMALPVNMYGTTGAVGGPAPAPGQHTREVLTELGYGPDQIRQLGELRAVQVGG